MDCPPQGYFNPEKCIITLCKPKHEREYCRECQREWLESGSFELYKLAGGKFKKAGMVEISKVRVKG